MLQSSLAVGRELRSLSFTDTYQMVSTNYLLLSGQWISPVLLAGCQAQPVSRVVGDRPNRVEPRLNKRRKKMIGLLKCSRTAWRALVGLAA